MSQTKKNGGNMTNVQDYEFPTKGEKTTFLEIFYNSKEGTYFGRTPENWAKLGLFYGIFYIVLAALFTICLQGLFATLNDNEPKWKTTDSLIGTNPGLGFRPLSEETERGSLIQFNTKKPGEADYWIKVLDEFFAQYKSNSSQHKHCSFGQSKTSQDVCIVDTDSFGPCSAKNQYGYNEQGSPCVFLKLNKIFNWEPMYYDDASQLPEDMPAELKQHITSLQQKNETQQIWVSCSGQHAVDNENFNKTHLDIKYYPQPGFPHYYYPYTNQPGYMSPLIAVQFENIKRYKMINVECRAWAKNVQYSGSIRDRQGSVAFQLNLD